jgi:hypothetical protein
MSLLQPIPILGTEGWIYTPAEKMDNLFMHFVESYYSQTVTATNSVYSFQRILHDFRDNPIGLVNQLKTVLATYFGGYYSEVNVEVDTIVNPKNADSLILRIYLTVKDEYGKEFNLAKISSDLSSKTIRWANINNYGNENIFA